MAAGGRSMRRHLRLIPAALAALAFRSFAFLQVFGSSDQSARLVQRRNLLTGIVGALSLEAFTPESNAYMQRKVAYPPINKEDPNRCQWRSSNIAQANAQREKLQDLRECKMAGTNADDKDIAGALLNKGDFTKVSFKNGIMTKAVAEESNFEGADFTNVVADRVEFKNANFKDAIFKNALLTSSDFTGVNVENADFTDAFLDIQSVKILCNNPTMKGKNPVTGADTYLSAGCDIADAGQYNR